MDSLSYLVFCSIFLNVLNVVNSKHPKVLPPYLKVCRRDDPKIDECIKESIEQLRPHLIKGIPDLGIPPIEPLNIPEVVFNQGRGPVSISSKYTNIDISGPSQFVVKALRTDLAKQRLLVKIWFPHLSMISDYMLDGRILMLPMTGKGRCEQNYTNIDATILIEGKNFEKHDKTYLDVQNLYIDFQIEDAKIKLYDLFNGDKQLGDTMNTFINDNWKIISQEIKAGLEENIAEMTKTFANNIFHKYPLDMLLPSISEVPDNEMMA